MLERQRAERAATMLKDTMIGVDLAKSVFQVHGASMTGCVRFRKKLDTFCNRSRAVTGKRASCFCTRSWLAAG